MSIAHILKELALKMTPTVWFYLSFCQSYEWLCVCALETVNSRKPHRKFIYHLDGM